MYDMVSGAGPLRKVLNGVNDATVEWAKEHGYDLTMDDLEGSQEALYEGELSDEELDQVVGGDGCKTCRSIPFIGKLCGVVGC